MKNLIILIIIFISSDLYSQSARIGFNTGDMQIEAHLNEVNDYASVDIALFRKDLAFRFRASKSEMDMYLVKERMRPADVYYGYVLSYITGRPFPEIMKMYKKKSGWGAIAKELGIKPGSDKFHALKNNTLKNIDREKIKSRKNKADKKEKDDIRNNRKSK